VWSSLIHSRHDTGNRRDGRLGRLRASGALLVGPTEVFIGPDVPITGEERSLESDSSSERRNRYGESPSAATSI